MTRGSLPSLSLALLTLAVLGCEPGAPVVSSPSDPPPGPFVAAPNVTVRSTTDLGTFGLDHGFGFEINDAGAVAGRTESGLNCANFCRAVFWSQRTGPIDLGTLGGASSETRALNNHGLVVGFAQKSGDVLFQGHPVIWYVRPSGVEMLELGSFVGGQVEDVNDAGVVVGWSTPVLPPALSVQTAFRWTAREGLTVIPPLAGTRSTALGINNAGDVVGLSSVGAGPDHAVIWRRDGTVTDIGTLGGNASARSINDRGEVTGHSRLCVGPPPCSPLQHAFYWSAADGMIDLGTFGGVQSFAFEIDNHGRVTGRYDEADGTLHAFVWSKATGKVDLPTLGGLGSSTGSINARGQMTGRAQDASGVFHAVIWQLGPATP